MAHRLTSGGTAAKYVTIPTCSLAGDFDITIVATQAGQTSGTFLFAGTGVAGQNGLDLYRNLSGKYQIFIDNTSVIAGTINASSNLAAPDTIRVSRVSGVVTLRVNGVADGTTSNSNTLRIDRFFHRNGWAHYGNMAFYTMSITAASGNRFYDASASGGAGTSLPDTTGSQNGTLVGFSVPADYVYYNSITANIPDNTLGAALSQPCAINLNNYFTGATSYSVQSGSLPAGLSIVGNQIVGTPTTTQSTTFVIRASNSIDMLDSETITFNTGLWYLRFTDTGWVDIPAFSALSTENWSFDLDFLVEAFPPSGIQGLLYHNSSNYVIVTTAGRINIQLPGIYINLSSFALSVNTRYLLSVVNTAGSGLAITINGTSVYSGAVRDVTFSSVVASSVSYRKVAGGIYKLSLVKGVGTRTYDVNTSGGVGNLLIDRVSNQNGTQSGTWPANDSEWVFYDDGGSSFSGVVGKTSLSSITKQLSTSLGYSVATGKSSATLNADQLDVSLGYSNVVNSSTNTTNTRQLNISVGAVLGVSKQSLVLNTQQESIQIGYVNVLSKQEYNLLTKQLSVVVGTNLPFIGTLNKTTYSLSGKQLDIVAGWNSGLNIQSLNVDGKQESTNIGHVLDINELNLDVFGKPFSIQTGTSISFVGELGNSDLNLSGKPLSVDSGTVIPFIGLLSKTSLNLSGKALSRLHGQILEIQKQSVTLVTKQLSIGEIVYPIIPVERLFTFTDKGRTYLFKQITNVYLLTNKNNTYLIKGK